MESKFDAPKVFHARKEVERGCKGVCVRATDDLLPDKVPAYGC